MCNIGNTHTYDRRADWMDMPSMQPPSGGLLMKMTTYQCPECKLYALGIEVENYEAICVCGTLMEVINIGESE
jgi:hypothetical protein